MSNWELRKLARARVRGRWGFLIAAFLISMLPSMVQTGLSMGFKIKNLTPLFGIMSGLLSLGLRNLALEQLEGGPKKLRGLVFWVRKDLLWRALILAALPYAAYSGIQWAVSGMLEAGRTILSVQPLSPTWLLLDTLLPSAVSFLVNTLLFPLGYVLILLADKGFGEQLMEGISLGWKKFWDIFFYNIMLSMPICGMLLVTVFIAMIGPLSLYPLISFIILFFIAWYFPYLCLANAALAGELFFPGKWADENRAGCVQSGGFTQWLGLDDRERPRKVLHRKLRGGGGWHYCVMGKGPAPGGPLETWASAKKS